MSEMICNGTFTTFLSGYLKTVWSHVGRVQLRAFIVSVLLASSLRVAAQAQTATPTPESGNEMEFRSGS